MATRTFKPHPKLLMDVITRQAGSLAKAILEGVMNSIDAGATLCEVTLDEKMLIITDDGRGFRDRNEIEKFFEVFGQPHSESERKIFGTFRMGRGQIFAYGHNTWRTGNFFMDVDIKERGLEYTLERRTQNANGCTISVDLYEPLDHYRLSETLRCLKHWCYYAPIVLIVNSDPIAHIAAMEPWDVTTDEAYIRFTAGKSALSVYNLGIHVFDANSTRFGMGGTVVTRKGLKVNFARNDVQSNCDVWKPIFKRLEAHAKSLLLKGKGLTESSRQHLIAQWVSRDIDTKSIEKLKLCTAVTGKLYTLSAALQHTSGKITVCPPGDPLGDRMHRLETVFVLSTETLAHFGFSTLEKFVQWGTNTLVLRQLPQVVPFAVLSKDVDRGYQILDDAQLTPKERIWVQLMQKSLPNLLYRLADHANPARTVLIGSSNVANGWTDSVTYIAVDRKFLKPLQFKFRDYVKVGRLLLHELCHDDNTATSHFHDQDFYEKFHDAAQNLGDFAENCLYWFPKLVETFDKSRVRAQARSTKAVASNKASADKLETLIAP